MAANPAGGMYAATDALDEFEYRTIQSFNANGQFVGTIGSGEAPNDVAVSPFGNLYLADGFFQSVQEYMPAGSFVRTYNPMMGPDFQGLTAPLSVASSNGSVWVTSGTNQMLRFNSATGQLMSQFTIPDITTTSGDVWNAVPSDIVVSNLGVIYVALTDNVIGPNQGNRILGLDFNRTLLGQFGEAGSGDRQFDFSYGSSLALDTLGRLFVADTGNQRVQIFNAATGEYLQQFGTEGTGIGQLTNPGTIGVDTMGNVWVADGPNGQSRIQIFSTVPEPATVAMAAVGLIGLIGAARRSRPRV